MKKFVFISCLTTFIACDNPDNASSVKVIGQMRDVMWKDQLEGKISTDSINHPTSYGLGPIEYLKGEVLLFEGKTYISKVRDHSAQDVSQIDSIRAPFFVYSFKSELQVFPIAGRNLSLTTLEQLIDSLYLDYDYPLLIRIDGVFKDLSIHSVNLATGSSVRSPDDAHEGLVNYKYQDVNGSIIGFFSRKHKAIFTHHNSYFHAHFLSDNRTIMGHVDAVFFDSDKSTFAISK